MPKVFIRIKYENGEKIRHSPEKHTEQVHPSVPNVSEHQNKLVAFNFKCIAFLQRCKRLKGFKFSFKIKDYESKFISPKLTMKIVLPRLYVLP